MRYVLLLILYFSTYFSRPLLAEKIHSDNKTNVNITKDIDCGLVSDNVLKELRLGKLCSVRKLQLEDIKIISVYDASPLLCSQFYQINNKFCNMSKDKSSNITFLNELKGKDFITNLRINNTNVTTYCNMSKQWNYNLGNSGLKDDPLSDYFYKVIGNETVCRRLCTSILDGNVTDLCTVIMWQQNHLERIFSKDVGKNVSIGKKFTESSEPKLFTDAKSDPVQTDALQNKPLDSKIATTDVVVNAPQMNSDSAINRPETDENPLTNVDQQQKYDDESVDTKLSKSGIEASNKITEKQIPAVVNPDINTERSESKYIQKIEDNDNDAIDTKDDAVDNNFEHDAINQDSINTPENVLDSDTAFEKPEVPGANAYKGRERLIENEDSHFSTYFFSMGVVFGIIYILFHNKKKILALAVEGRRSRNYGGSRRRPNTAAYSKLDSNLEEAMVSNVSQDSVSHVLY